MIHEQDDDQASLPAMRTFKVIAYRYDAEITEFVQAHSVTCEADAAHFYVYRHAQTAQGPGLIAMASRTLRPYLDVEDVTTRMAPESNLTH